MISVWTIIRILVGIIFLSMDTVTEDMTVVNKSPAHITSVLINRFVTARVEQIPRTCLRTGLSFQMPAIKISLFVSLFCMGIVSVWLNSSIYSFINISKMNHEINRHKAQGTWHKEKRFFIT